MYAYFMSHKTLLLTFMLATAGIVCAQPKGGGKGGGNQAQAIKEVKPGLYLVTGAGGNSSVRVTSEGIILVDGKLPAEGNYDKLMELIKSVSNQPIKYMLLTHHHQDHTGNNDKFLALGIPVIAHENLKSNLVTYAATPKPASPSVTYSKDYTVKLGGVTVEAHHFGRAHTSGDTVVYFPDLKVVAVSDVLTVGSPAGSRAPLADYAGGGSLVEWPAVLDAILKLDWDLAIPGNDDPQPRSYVQSYRDNIARFVDRGKAAVKMGVPKDQLLASIKTDDLPFKINLQAAALDGFYDELSKAK
jgi:glyoxylase-like metal-dependent hydrolase (beta-lactamase superfamily II)